MSDLKRNVSTLYISAFLLYEMLCYLTNAMIMPAMINVITYLHANNSDISTTAIIYITGVCLTPLLISMVADTINKPKILILGCIIFCLSNFFCPFSHNIVEFSIFRFFQGVGQGCIFLGYTLIHESFDDIPAVKITSIMTNIAVLAPLLGPVFGSLIAISLGWKYIFWITGSMSLIALIGLLGLKPKVKITPIKINFKLLINNYCAIVGSKKFLLGVGIMTLALIPSELWMIFSIIIVMTTLHETLLIYNIYMIMIVGSSILSTIVLNTLVDRFSFVALIKLGCFISVVATTISIIVVSNHMAFVLCLSFSVFGGGLFRGIIYRSILTDVHHEKNTVSALFNFILALFLMLIIELTNSIFKWKGYSLHNFAWIALFSSIICFLFSLYFARLKKQFKDTELAADSNL